MKGSKREPLKLVSSSEKKKQMVSFATFVPSKSSAGVAGAAVSSDRQNPPLPNSNVSHPDEPVIAPLKPKINIFNILADIDSKGAMQLQRTVSELSSAAEINPISEQSVASSSAMNDGGSTCLLSQLLNTAKDVIPKHKIEVEANFDLKAFLKVPELMQDVSHQPTDGSDDPVTSSLSNFAAEQCVWVCPYGRSHVPQKLSNSSASSSTATIRSHLNNSELWTVPPEENDDIVSAYKRRRLIWQDGICSALERLKKDKMTFFYVLSAGVCSQNKASADASKYAGWNLSGFFCSKQYCRELLALADQSVIPNNSEDQEEVCVLTGVPKSFQKRMLALGIRPVLIADVSTFNSLQAARKRAFSATYATGLHKQDLTSSAGVLEKSIEGQSFLISGTAQVALAIDCLGEYFFSTTQTTRVSSDVPKIISRMPFAGAVRVPLRCAILPNLTVPPSGTSSAPNKVAKSAVHRMSLTGDILPSLIPSLAAALVALGLQSHNNDSANEGHACVVTADDLDPAALKSMNQSVLSSSAPVPPPAAPNAGLTDAVSLKNVMVKNPFSIVSVRVDDDKKDSRVDVNAQRSSSIDAEGQLPFFRIKLFAQERLVDFSYSCVKNQLAGTGAGAKSNSDPPTVDGIYHRCLDRLEEVNWQANSESWHSNGNERMRNRAGTLKNISQPEVRVEYHLTSSTKTVGLYSMSESDLQDPLVEVIRIETGKEYDVYADN